MERQEVCLLEEELDELRNRLLEMGALVESTVYHNIFSLVDKDQEQTKGAEKGHSQRHDLEIGIDELASRRLAFQQLAATDLRFITTAIKINDDLERMSALAVNVSERALSLIHEIPAKPLMDIPHLARVVESMVRKALAAFVNRDGALARTVLESSDAVQGLRDTIYHELLSFMERDPERVAQGVNLMLVSRNLERIADHAINIADDVLFLVQGSDVRYPAKTRE